MVTDLQMECINSQLSQDTAKKTLIRNISKVWLVRVLRDVKKLPDKIEHGNGYSKATNSCQIVNTESTENGTDIVGTGT